MRKILLFAISLLCCVTLAACAGSCGCGKNEEKIEENVFLVDKEITVYVGGTYKFTPSGAETFTYRSSNENIVKVDSEGVLTGISDGIGFVDVSAGEKSVTCRVNVLKNENYIRIGSANRFVVVGGDVTIKAEAIVNGNIADSEVAFTCDKTEGITLVNDGKDTVVATVTAVGNYTITTTCGSLVATCTIKAVSPSAKTIATPTVKVEDCMTLKWDAVEGASGYEVTVNGGAPIAVSETEYYAKDVADALRNGDKAVFSVCAVSAADNFDYTDGLPATIDFSHKYIEHEITPHSCTETGESEFTCSDCGIKYTDRNRLDDHNFVDGVCSVCGFGQTQRVAYAYDSINDCYYVAGADAGYNSADLYIRSKYNDGNPAHGEKNVKYFTLGAFKNNNTIKRVFLPASMTEFTDLSPDFKYSNGNSLNTINGKSSPLKGQVFEGCSELEYISMPGIHALPAVAEGAYSHWNFRDCYNLTTVIVPEGFENYGAGFMRWNNTPKNAVNRTDIYVIGDSVKRISDPLSYPIGNDVGYGNNTLLTGDIFYLDESADEDSCFKWKYAADGKTVVSGGKHDFNGKDLCRKCGAENDYGVIYGYNEAKGEYFVSGVNGNATEIVVPATYNDGNPGHGVKPVTYVASNCQWGAFVKKIVLPESVTDFGGNSFQSAINLEYISMTGVTKLTTNNNFINCEKLGTVIVNKDFKLNTQQFKNNSRCSGVAAREIVLEKTDDSITKVVVRSDDCNPFGVQAGDFKDITNSKKHSSKTAPEATIKAFDNFASSFASFIGGFAIPADGSKYVPAGDNLTKYTALYNNAIAAYNRSIMSFTHTEGNGIGKSAVIGITTPFAVTTSMTSVGDYGKLAANLFGFGSAEDFAKCAKGLVETYKKYNSGSALDNGCFYTANKSFVFPITVRCLDTDTVVLTHVIIENDRLSVWVNDIDAALGVTNFNKLDKYNGETLNNELYCKNYIFIADPMGVAKVVVYVNGSAKESSFYYVNDPSPTSGQGNELLTGNVYYFGDLDKCGNWNYDGDALVHSPYTEHDIDKNGVCTRCGEKGAMGVTYTYYEKTDETTGDAFRTYYVSAYTGSGEYVYVHGTWDDGVNGEHAVTYVAANAFARKRTIKTVILPESVTLLGGSAFLGSENLEYVDVCGVKTLFQDNKTAGLDGSTDRDNNFLGCTKLKTVVVGDGFNSNVGQFHETNKPNLYVKGTTAPSLTDSEKVGNIYYYNKIPAANYWHYVDGIATLWNN